MKNKTLQKLCELKISNNERLTTIDIEDGELNDIAFNHVKNVIFDSIISFDYII